MKFSNLKSILTPIKTPPAAQKDRRAGRAASAAAGFLTFAQALNQPLKGFQPELGKARGISPSLRPAPEIPFRGASAELRQHIAPQMPGLSENSSHSIISPQADQKAILGQPEQPQAKMSIGPFISHGSPIIFGGVAEQTKSIHLSTPPARPEIRISEYHNFVRTDNRPIEVQKAANADRIPINAPEKIGQPPKGAWALIEPEPQRRGEMNPTVVDVERSRNNVVSNAESAATTRDAMAVSHQSLGGEGVSPLRRPELELQPVDFDAVVAEPENAVKSLKDPLGPANPEGDLATGLAAPTGAGGHAGGSSAKASGLGSSHLRILADSPHGPTFFILRRQVEMRPQQTVKNRSQHRAKSQAGRPSQIEKALSPTPPREALAAPPTKTTENPIRETIADRPNGRFPADASHLKLQYIQNIKSLAEKIQARAKLLNQSGETTLEVQLSPPRLGRLRLRVEVQGAEMRLHFSAERQEAMAPLRDVRAELSHLMANQGYDLAQCNINVSTFPDGWRNAHQPYLPEKQMRPAQDNGRHPSSEDDSPKLQAESPFCPLDFGYNTLDLVA